MEQSVNNAIIEPVFRSLMENTPHESEIYGELELLSLKTGGFATQRRGGKLIECFPWPIGKELSSLFSSSYITRNEARLAKIFRVAERLAQFLSYCWVVQVWDAKRSNPEFSLSADFQTQVRHIWRPSFGASIGLIRASDKLLQSAGQRYFFGKEPIQRVTPQLLQSFQGLVELRNAEAHHRGKVHCEDAEELLSKVLEYSGFLVRFPMISVKDISVKKHKLTEATFIHAVDQLNSQRSDFSGGTVEMGRFAESYSVMLVENLSSFGEYLNLSPFLIDTEPLLASRGRSQILQGLYMFAEYTNGKYSYAFIEELQVHFLHDVPHHEIFERQWQDLKEVLENA